MAKIHIKNKIDGKYMKISSRVKKKKIQKNTKEQEVRTIRILI